MNIQVVIVTFQAEQWIKSLLSSLRCSNTSCSVIVVDNHSMDLTTDIISHEFPEVTLLCEKENLGFGKANNRGINKALESGADYIFLLNQDTTIYPDTLATLLSVAEQADEKTMIFSPIQLNGDGTHIDNKFVKYLHEQACPGFISDAYIEELKDAYPITYTNAAAWFIRSKCFEMIGGFDPIFFMYGEDTNFLQRLNYHDYKMELVPMARINHARDQDVKRLKRWSYEKFSDAYFMVLESDFKSSFANINNREPNYVLLLVKSLLSLVYRLSLGGIREFRMKCRWLKEIRSSRTKNKKMFPHYLHYDIAQA